MNVLFYIPFLIQTLVIGLDEFHFHLKRGLPKWERIGHPIDTLSVVLALAFTLVFPYQTSTLIAFIILAAASAILVTKDEFVHKEHCPASEQWLHALLFLNHPLVLISMGFLWVRQERLFLLSQLILSSLFVFIKSSTGILYGKKSNQ